MMYFVWIKPSLLPLFLYFDCLWKQVQKTPVQIFKTRSRAQKIGYSGEKKINEFSIFVANSK